MRTQLDSIRSLESKAQHSYDIKMHSVFVHTTPNQERKGEGEGRKNTLHQKKLFVFLPICLCGWANNDSPTSRFEISATSAASLSFCQLETLHLDEVGQLEYSLQFLPPPSWPLSFPLLVLSQFPVVYSCTSRFLTHPVVHPNTFKISLFVALFRLHVFLSNWPLWTSLFVVIVHIVRLFLQIQKERGFELCFLLIEWASFSFFFFRMEWRYYWANCTAFMQINGRSIKAAVFFEAAREPGCIRW